MPDLLVYLNSDLWMSTMLVWRRRAIKIRSLTLSNNGKWFLICSASSPHHLLYFSTSLTCCPISWKSLRSQRLVARKFRWPIKVFRDYDSYIQQENKTSESDVDKAISYFEGKRKRSGLTITRCLFKKLRRWILRISHDLCFGPWFLY